MVVVKLTVLPQSWISHTTNGHVKLCTTENKPNPDPNINPNPSRNPNCVADAGWGKHVGFTNIMVYVS